MKYTLIFFVLLCCFRSFAQTRSLNEYVEVAQSNSPLLRGYRAQILSNQLDSLILRASLRTQVNFLSNNLYAPTIAGFGYDPAITNIAQLSALLQATKNFYSRDYILAQYRNITLQNQALRDTLLLTARDLTRTIADQYITAYGDLLTMNYSRELYNLLQGEADALKKLAQASLIKQTEFLAFDITVQQQQLTFLQAQIQYNADFLTLNYLAGISDTAIGVLEEPHLEDSSLHDFYSTVFYHRFITDSLRIANEHRLIDYSYRPVWGTTVDGGYNSSLQDNPYKNFGFSFGVSVRVPIYDGHQRRLRHEQVNIQERTRVYNKAFFQNQFNQQVALLNIQLNQTQQLFDKIRQQLTYSRTLIDAYGKLLQTGDVRITDFVTAITSYLNAQNTYRQNIISRLRILNQINYWSR